MNPTPFGDLRTAKLDPVPWLVAAAHARCRAPMGR
jgi:hypothetical protein